MTQNDIRISKQFCKFCVRVLKHEAVNIEAEFARQRKREKSLDELTNDEIISLSAYDEYFADEHIFKVLDKEIVVNDAVLADVISKLPQAKRDVILLSFFAGMTDKEIGRELGAIQKTISKRRLSSLLQIRKLLDEEGFE